MSEKVVLIMDFDGVLNWHGTSRNQIRKYADTLGYPRKTDIPVDNVTEMQQQAYQQWQRVEWSAELIQKLMELKEETGYLWLWLTTWVGQTNKLDVALNIKSDGCMNWNPYPDFDVPDISLFRCERKLELVLDFIKNNPDTPFVWVDDEATKLWTSEHEAACLTPHLIVTPLEKYGVVKHELTKVVNFVKNNS